MLFFALFEYFFNISSTNINNVSARLPELLNIGFLRLFLVEVLEVSKDQMFKNIFNKVSRVVLY